MNTLQCFGLPKNTKENHKISIFRLADSDPKNFYYVDIVRLIMTMLDGRFVHCDDNELIDGEVGIIDVSGFGFRHFTQVLSNISTLKAYSRYAQVRSGSFSIFIKALYLDDLFAMFQGIKKKEKLIWKFNIKLQEAAPIKIVQNHFINCSPIMEKLLAVITPFLNKEVLESLKVHTTLESLHKFIPKKVLPIEYGGDDYSLEELHPQVKAWLEENELREYLMIDDNWRIEDLI